MNTRLRPQLLQPEPGDAQRVGAVDLGEWKPEHHLIEIGSAIYRWTVPPRVKAGDSAPSRAPPPAPPAARDPLALRERPDAYSPHQSPRPTSTSEVEMRYRMIRGPAVSFASAFLVLAFQDFGAHSAPRDDHRVIEGIAQDITREFSDPKREPLNREKLRFVVVRTIEVDGLLREESVGVEMIKRVTEGTVRKGSKVRVEGDWRHDVNRIRADKITDLETGATVGYKTSRPRFGKGTRVALRGTALFVEEKVAGHKGEWDEKQKIRLVVQITEDGGSVPRGHLVSVEMVKRTINGNVRDGKEVRAVGEWTDRNVLRAETITDIETGEVTR